MFILPETELIRVNKTEQEENEATFIIEPLLPGFGLTLGNALRRVLLSSLSGAAISSIKINGITHEFSTIKGVKEDVIELILNLKGVMVRMSDSEAAVIKLHKKGSGIVKAADFDKNAQVEISNPNQVIAHLDKDADLQIEATVEYGRGYVPTEKRKDEKLPLGTIAIDAIYTPIKKVYYDVENTRVGGMTNFDKLTVEITTYGTITPQEALSKSIQILLDKYNHVKNILDQSAEKAIKPKTKKSAKKEVKLIDLDESAVQAKKPAKSNKSAVKKIKK